MNMMMDTSNVEVLEWCFRDVIERGTKGMKERLESIGKYIGGLRRQHNEQNKHNDNVLF